MTALHPSHAHAAFAPPRLADGRRPATSPPEIALCLTTYQKPRHLRLALRSIALQQGVAGKIELVVADDGSTDETPEIVAQFRREVDFPVYFTTHPHDGFHAARVRNEGVAATCAPYLLLLDGDCILPPHHVATHLACRRPGAAQLGDCCRLEKEVSARLNEATIARDHYSDWSPLSETNRLRKRDRRFRGLQALLHRKRRPGLVSNNCGIWRDDFFQINGFDEAFRGWGGEDDDLGFRLRHAGVKLESILRWTNSIHIWHPLEPSAPTNWLNGPNVEYMRRKSRLTRCRNGLVKRPFNDLAVRILGRPDCPEKAVNFLDGASQAAAAHEVEFLFLPGTGHFSRQADCRVLVVLEDCPRAWHLAPEADVVIADRLYPGVLPKQQFSLADRQRAFDSIC